MQNSKEISRQEFLKIVPKYVMQNVRSLIERRTDSSDRGEVNAWQDILTNINASKTVQLKTEYCIAWDGGNCQYCYLACPLRDKAITLVEQRPTINISYCDGCGLCVSACQTVNDRPALKMAAGIVQ